MKESKWADLGIKEKLAILTAIIAFCLGWSITAIAAFIPLYISEQGVLFILGQALVYTASVFGVSAYFTSESRRMRSDLRQMMDDERRKIESKIDDESE